VQQPILKYWNRKQLSILIFLLACINTLKNLHPDQFDDQQWLALSHLLPATSAESLKYKWISLTHKPSDFQNTWSFKDDYILMEIIYENEHSLLDANRSKYNVKWSRIAMKFNHQSQNNKLGKHCKERWFNHLSPHLNKTVWTDEEDILLLENAIIHSKKWIKIASSFPGRTQHHVKNRFLSLIARENKISSKKLSLKEECSESLILSTLCSLKRRFNCVKLSRRNKMISDDSMQISSEYDENLEMIFKNEKRLTKNINEMSQINEKNLENPSTDELDTQQSPLKFMTLKSSEEINSKKVLWFDDINFKSSEFEKFEEVFFEKQAKWNDEITNDEKETEILEEHLETFDLFLD